MAHKRAGGKERKTARVVGSIAGRHKQTDPVRGAISSKWVIVMIDLDKKVEVQIPVLSTLGKIETSESIVKQEASSLNYLCGVNELTGRKEKGEKHRLAFRCKNLQQ